MLDKSVAMIQDTSKDNGTSVSRAPPPPPNYEVPTGKYVPEESALGDIAGIKHALDLFLASHMVESETYCHEMDPSKERLYYATGYGLIQCVKALMSFEDVDLLAAIGHIKHGNMIANQHRKQSASLPTRLVGLLIGSLNTSGVGWVKSMTAMERHAELVYAESLFESALLGIVYSGDWLAFVKEALNMRTIIGIYRQLGKYIDAMDAEAVARGEGPQDKSIDEDFRSGVYLGNGAAHLILSLMPSRILTIVELFGYKGDRKIALELLNRSGGWTKESNQPSVSIEKEGVRRSICDMVVLIFHLILSSFTFDGVDVTMAQKVLDWNLKRYPNGIFFLFGAGRLSLVRSQPRKAVEHYMQAKNAQNQYRNLSFISDWEMAIANLSLWDIPASFESWKVLKAEGSWSKACYAFGMAVCLLHLGGEENKKLAVEIFADVPNLRQRIAGKSIPLEKFFARRVRKFLDQKHRLTLPALELAYTFLGITHAPREIIVDKMMPQVDVELAKLKEFQHNPKSYEGGQAYWDDFCLTKFLEGVCMRYIAYPDTDAVLDPNEKIMIERSDAEERAKKAFQTVFEHGTKIEWDHHLVYHAHYEYGRLLVCAGEIEAGKAQLELVYSGKTLEVNASGKRGKYSMENALHLRAHAALELLKTDTS